MPRKRNRNWRAETRHLALDPPGHRSRQAAYPTKYSSAPTQDSSLRVGTLFTSPVPSHHVAIPISIPPSSAFPVTHSDVTPFTPPYDVTVNTLVDSSAHFFDLSDEELFEDELSPIPPKDLILYTKIFKDNCSTSKPSHTPNNDFNNIINYYQDIFRHYYDSSQSSPPIPASPPLKSRSPPESVPFSTSFSEDFEHFRGEEPALLQTSHRPPLRSASVQRGPVWNPGLEGRASITTKPPRPPPPVFTPVKPVKPLRPPRPPPPVFSPVKSRPLRPPPPVFRPCPSSSFSHSLSEFESQPSS
ncbi:uncharacterized protein LOC133569320 [Nerophis ophidion]|uniref:uncharacterized protein LOC133569320 n=1 Tax=Nerophis ophidion TaxID=159077 RepID=UPI002ADFE91A|nr:uncharacterized protein LOC133569320 [Nerophis ophidion]